jgi:hypothetical protein
LDQQIISSTSNIVHAFECVHKKGEDGEYNPRDSALFKKLQKIQKLVGRFSNNKSKTIPWRLQALKAAMQQCKEWRSGISPKDGGGDSSSEVWE